MNNISNDSKLNKNPNVIKINKVDYRFKIIYFINMFCVIASHCHGTCSIELNIQGWFDYRSFHMPLFMFAAGYFFKHENVRHIKNYILRKFKRLIFPIYIYNLFYGIYIQILSNFGFKNNIKLFSFRTILIAPLNGEGFKHIGPSWFSSSLFFVELYNILKRKLAFIFMKKGFKEYIYLIIDIIISYSSVTISNKGLNNTNINIYILRFMHLNIYYELGIFYKYHMENYIKKVRNDLYFLNIFLYKLFFHLYYSKAPSFYYGKSQYYNYTPFTVISISALGIFFWVRISEITEPLIGKNYYINIIADNTFSIMINHFLALDIVRFIFAFISKNTKYCRNFNFKRFYSLEPFYIYLPNNVLQSGIIYLLSCMIIPILIQKMINKFKYFILKRKN